MHVIWSRLEIHPSSVIRAEFGPVNFEEVGRIVRVKSLAISPLSLTELAKADWEIGVVSLSSMSASL